MKIVAGSIEKMTSMSAIKPPSLPILSDIVQLAVPYPIV
jgi:hypothetical protein